MSVAASNGRAHVLRCLLAAAGGDPDRDRGSGRDYSSSGKFTPGFFACKRQHHDCVRVLQALGAAPDHCTGKYTGNCTCPPDIAR